MGKIELEGTPEVRWNRAVARIALEGRFHHLLNGLALHAVNTAYAPEIQQFSIEYDRLVASRMATDTGSLQKELNELISADEPKSLAMLGQRFVSVFEKFEHKSTMMQYGPGSDSRVQDMPPRMCAMNSQVLACGLWEQPTD